MHIFDPNPREPEVGGSLGVPASLIHIGLCNEILGGGERRGVERSSFLSCYSLSVSQMTPGSQGISQLPGQNLTTGARMKYSCCGISGASKMMIGCPCKSLVMISLIIAAWMVPKDGEGCFVSSHWFPLSVQPHLVRFSNPQVSVFERIIYRLPGPSCI